VILLDVNVLVHAFHEASPEHAAYRAWLEATVEADEPFGLSELVLSGFVRVATHPRVFDPPAPVGEALAFADALRSQPSAVFFARGTRHWAIFERLCVTARANGNLVADAYLAALAIESGCEWITSDRDFSRFPGLRWRHPLVGT
jgi:toxin-antitoxin system PIN domain toxin